MVVPMRVAIKIVVRRTKMSCENVKECACPKTTCPNYKKCCVCIIKHRETDSLPYCMFLDNDGDKSVANYYKRLRERFE